MGVYQLSSVLFEIKIGQSPSESCAALVGTRHGRVVAFGPRVRRATAAPEYGISGIADRRGLRRGDDCGFTKEMYRGIRLRK